MMKCARCGQKTLSTIVLVPWPHVLHTLIERAAHAVCRSCTDDFLEWPRTPPLVPQELPRGGPYR